MPRLNVRLPQLAILINEEYCSLDIVNIDLTDALKVADKPIVIKKDTLNLFPDSAVLVDGLALEHQLLNEPFFVKNL